VGLAAAAIAKRHGGVVVATTRRADREALLRENGADEVLIDDGEIAPKVNRSGARPDKVLELIGTASLLDSLRCCSDGGVVCMTGIVGNQWSFDRFSPMEAIPTAVCLTIYSGDDADFMRTPLEELAQQVAAGSLHVPIGRTFHLDQIVEAHATMEENRAGGKIVVLT
jgi:NADPH:quinone reductase-like Zn-dependent oxidoreductase